MLCLMQSRHGADDEKSKIGWREAVVSMNGLAVQRRPAQKGLFKRQCEGVAEQGR